MGKMGNSVIRVLVMASDAIAYDTLEALYSSKGIFVCGLVTQEDKRRGRNEKLRATKVALWAGERGIETFKTSSVNTDEFLNFFSRVKPNLCLVFAFGQLLSREVLDLCLFINIHTSLLPKYRGASPIESALLNGDKETGISFMRVIESLDAGPIFKQIKVPISAEDNYLSLRTALSLNACQSVVSTLRDIYYKKIKEYAQEKEKVSYCHKILKGDGLINWAENKREILNKLRAFSYWPKSYFFLEIEKRKKRIIVEEACEIIPSKEEINDANRLIMKCGDGYIEILSLILEGKKCMSAKEFLNGHKKLNIIK